MEAVHLKVKKVFWS